MQKKLFFGLFNTKQPVSLKKTKITKNVGFLSLIGLAVFAFSVFFAAVGTVEAAVGQTSVKLISPLGGANIHSPSPQISGATNTKRMFIWLDGKRVGEAKVEANKFYYSPKQPLLAGEHTIGWQAFNEEGNILEQNLKANTFSIVSNPPPTWVMPKNKDNLGQDRVWLGGVAKNNSTIRAYFDDLLFAEVKVKNHPSGTGSFSVDLSGAPFGVHTVSASAVDEAGKESFVSVSPEFRVVPSTPAPLLALPLTDSETGGARPFVRGLAKNGLEVSIVINDIIKDTFTPGEHPSGATSFVWQPKDTLPAGKYKIEAFSSDKGKLSKNSGAIYWSVKSKEQVAEPATSNQPNDGISDGMSVKEENPIIVKEDQLGDEKVMVRQDKQENIEEPLIPDAVLDYANENIPTEIQNSAEPEGNIMAEDDLAEGDKLEELLALLNEGSSGDGVETVAPGAVIKNTQESQDSDNKAGVNSSLIIGIVILVLLLISIIIWYIQEKKESLGDRVANIFREIDESDESGSNSIKMDNGEEIVAKSDFGRYESNEDDENKKNDNLPPPPPPVF